MFLVKARKGLIAGLVGTAGLASLGVSTQAGATDRGAVYVLTNQVTANSVLVYSRSPDGAIALAGQYATGGLGANSGPDPLGSQGSIATEDGFVFAVNAGSNDITVFRADDARLEAVGRYASGGTMPVSLAVRDGLVYVLNAGGQPNISGFRLDARTGALDPVQGSQRPLAGGAASKAAEVRFSPDGRILVVTEKGTGLIDTYTVDPHGIASGPQAYPSSGAVPFGFSITRRGYVVVTEAGGGSVSSYDVEDDGSLKLLSGSVALGQQAVCWLVTTGNGRFAYSANAGSSTISSLAVAPDGTLATINVAAATPAAPLDMAMTADSSLLYVRDGTGALTGYRVARDGSLELINTAAGVPPGSQGIAVR